MSKIDEKEERIASAAHRKAAGEAYAFAQVAYHANIKAAKAALRGDLTITWEALNEATEAATAADDAAERIGTPEAKSEAKWALDQMMEAETELESFKS